jgi:squalene cyclase
MALTDDSNLNGAIAAGVGYILRRQSAEGFWTDWELPRGSSRAWTTAYVATHLQSVPPALCPQAEGALVRAARWLLRTQFPDGGWGYNETVGSDADSTAWSILALEAAFGRAPPAAYDHLIGYQRPDGGFATYRGDAIASSWSVSHPDVTPIALLALAPLLGGSNARVRKGVTRVVEQQRADGLWNSFWWDSPLYGTHVSLELLADAGARSRKPVDLAQLTPANAFEAALLLACATRVATKGGLIERCVRRLVHNQRSDGGWTSVPILRITQRSCFEPWAASARNPLFRDPQQIFTSATALDALCRAHGALRAAHARTQCSAEVISSSLDE